MASNYEDSLLCLVNMRVTRRWRREAHEQAWDNGMNLTEYLKHLVEQAKPQPRAHNTWSEGYFRNLQE